MKSYAYAFLMAVSFTICDSAAQEVQKSGQLLNDQSRAISEKNLENLLINDLQLEIITGNVRQIRDLTSNVISYEADRIEKYISYFRPREEVITVTIYNHTHDGDDGGDDGGDGDGGSGSGAGACGSD